MSKNDPPPYSPPQPGFVHPGHYASPQMHPPPSPATQTVVVTQIIPAHLGDAPTAVTCPHCHASILTTVEVQPNWKTHLIALILCCFICWPCVCLPYCMDSCQSKRHFCPNCKAYLGSYSD